MSKQTALETLTQTSDSILRSAVKGVYDLQKLRVSNGNRLVAQLKLRLGSEPGKKEEDTLSEDAQKVIAELKKNYKKIMDGVVQGLPDKKHFVGVGLIHEYAELGLMDNYMDLESQEEKMFGQIKDMVESHPLWVTFLSKVKGCGPAFAAAILGSIDIRKATYPSSLWKYCGYDVVKVGRVGKKAVLTSPAGMGIQQDISIKDLFESNKNKKDTATDLVFHMDNLTKAETENLSVADLEFTSEGRSKKVAHCVDKFLYNDDMEVIKSWKALPYNPWIKSKLWLLAHSFLKCGLRWKEVTAEEFNAVSDPLAKAVEKDKFFLMVPTSHKYVQIYLNQKGRRNADPSWAANGGAHIHNDAIRITIKRFLVDLYNAWRPLVGLPVAPEYSVAKLGLIHGSASKYETAGSQE